jgi:hypothetical protein
MQWRYALVLMFALALASISARAEDESSARSDAPRTVQSKAERDTPHCVRRSSVGTHRIRREIVCRPIPNTGPGPQAQLDPPNQGALEACSEDAERLDATVVRRCPRLGQRPVPLL